MLLFSEEMTELKIQIETGFETEQDLKKSLLQLEGNDVEHILPEQRHSLSALPRELLHPGSTLRKIHVAQTF